MTGAGKTATGSHATSAVFTTAVTLVPAEPHHFDLAFTAVTQPCPWPKAYGGDLVAQAAAAAMRSVTDGKTLHSTHSYFLRPADIGASVRYEVEVVRDGRGYSTRQVRGYQHGKPLYVCLANFAAGEAGGAFHARPPEDVPDPERLPSSARYLAGRDGGTMTDTSKTYWSTGRGFDMRHVPGPVYLTVEGERVAHQAVWLKPFDPLRPVEGLTDAQRDLAALAYVCDYTILEPVLRVLDLPWARPGLVTASLDHAMWFHRPGPVGDWLLYVQDAVAADAGRGVATGRFFTRDHRHLATVVQEGMIRTV
ncbi:acyl-CoA thioesterase [Streptantibioticus cattleyicolor]|uniref:Putative acyl-CoA thioesterase n=1 Tax=Streptantibioticus cattleyicolor (strain ATCC 35852 / DSM 46488 / JCM 4925 / NBRC 14057 / NRRL 8057) TaxID=1003195 RepID=F8JL33_STREN|nr:acyl-CoA thioesterase domain-containing protein [Streptantibioticus cattleyicolor]AEW98388.1 putative acyl-CoA thioesterase [Streptantibioticus cattleyicolor NRRL 8057 = DSM 46488]CCB72553.1 putative acyl-CoA thioesterase [Streptantibioticus cattleyicolor NRRL 8057 = DSM 46488]